jgi:HEAT repeat protein
MCNLVPKDFNFEKVLHSDPFRMRIVDQGLNNPLETATELMQLHEFSRTASLSAILQRAASLAAGPAGKEASYEAVAAAEVKMLPADLQQPVLSLVNWMKRTNAEIRLAVADLKPAELRSLIESLPQIAVEDPKVQFEFAKSPSMSWDAATKLLARVDLARIQNAGATMAAAVERVTPILKQSKADIKQPIAAVIGGLSVVIGGRGDDAYAEGNERLLIDLGGNDRYRGRHAAGVGYASALLDLGGEDDVRVGDLSMGAGLLGVGIAKFGAGTTSFRGGSICFGAGIAGVGALAKEGGDDDYRAETLALGFGFFGVGVLVDHIGNESYGVSLFGQGSSRTQGVGWLIDRRGADTYRAGGLIANSPLFNNVTYSFAQGFSSGFREDDGGLSGGMGMLTDLSGDDIYAADTYAQASSYWYGLGTLFDADGNDTYTGYHYVQASAMHHTSAYLFDLAGDDGYLTKFGASHAIGHDYATAFLLDRKGNDIYSARDSAPGTGNANGLGVFIDAEGDDRYQGPPGRGNGARDTGSLGVFADLGGQDKYLAGLNDGEASVTNLWGVAFDRDVFVAPTVNRARPKPVPNSVPMPEEAEIARIYDRAIKWGVGTLQQDVADAVDQLIRIGDPALDWILAKRISSSDRLSLRAIGSLAAALGDSAKPKVATRMLNATESDTKRLLSLATTIGAKEVAPLLPGLIARAGTRREAIVAAGKLGGEESVSVLLPLCLEPDVSIATAASISLAQIGSETAYTTAESLMNSAVLPIRRAAIQLVAKHPKLAMASVDRLFSEARPASSRSAIEVLAAIGTPDALAKIGPRLRDSAHEVRISAMVALNGRCPSDFKVLFFNLRNDPNPSVRAVAKRMDPGR